MSNIKRYNSAYQRRPDGVFVAYEDYEKEIKRLEKAVELMRSALNEISGKFGVTTMKGFLNQVDQKTAEQTLAEVDEILNTQKEK